MLLRHVIDEEGSGCDGVVLNTGEPNVNSSLWSCPLIVYVNTENHHVFPRLY